MNRYAEVILARKADELKLKLPKPPVLLLLQNMHGGGGRMRYPTYPPAQCYRKNATYSRILPYLEPHFSLRLAECTPKVAGRGDHKSKFDTDLKWVERAYKTRDDWHAVIAFGQQAKKAITSIGVQGVHFLPHPIVFSWRRQLIEDLRAALLEASR